MTANFVFHHGNCSARANAATASWPGCGTEIIGECLAPDQRYLQAAMAALRERYPVFAEVRISQSWAGFIDAAPDAVPVISAVDGLSGLIVATGFSGHGFGIAPGAGHLVADLASGVRPIVNPRNSRLSRFFDGSRPRPITGV